MRKSPMKVIALSIAAVSFLAACGSDSDSASEEVTVDSAVEVTDDTAVTEETAPVADAPDTSKGEIPEGGIEVAFNGDVAGWAGAGGSRREQDGRRPTRSPISRGAG